MWWLIFVLMLVLVCCFPELTLAGLGAYVLACLLTGKW